MSEAENKVLISRMLAGEIDWLEQWASDAVWVIPGSTKWSGTYSGKTNIARNLLGPLTAELKSLGKFEIDNVVAEGNYVVVQGHVTGRVTKTGQQYNNTYCLIYEIVAGKIRKHTEYCDTELITKAFGSSPSLRDATETESKVPVELPAIRTQREADHATSGSITTRPERPL